MGGLEVTKSLRAPLVSLGKNVVIILAESGPETY